MELNGKRFLDNEDIAETVAFLALAVEKYADERKLDEVKCWGVPRGGLHVLAKLVATCEIVHPVSTWQEADVVVDDIIDSGSTANRYADAGKTVLALYGRALWPLFDPHEDAAYGTPTHTVMEHTDEWLVFPWEGDETGSAEDIVTRMLQYMGEDPARGGLVETPKRVLKAWREMTSGYRVDPRELLKTFEDGAQDVDEMVLVSNIRVMSQCEHHVLPFVGVAHVGYIPNGKIVGLSKLARLVDAFARRLQVQERLTTQIADTLWEVLEPKGVGVVIQCRHMCMELRGVQQPGSITTTSAMRGALMDKPEARAEFLRLVDSAKRAEVV
jgi:GTP cyclohydrolase I